MKIIRDNIWAPNGMNSTSSVQWSYWNDIIPFGNEYICFNTLSGAVAVLKSQEYSLYHKQPSSAPDSLTKSGIIVSGQKKEKDEWLQQYIKGKNDESILDLTIVSTMQCQFKCVYCFEGDKGKQVLTNHTIEHIKKLVENRKKHLKILRITWFGGEPLLNMTAILKLSAFFIDFCSQNGIKYIADITTNGYVLSSSLCNTLVNECNIRRYIITIDGTPEMHNRRRPLQNGKDTFDRIWGNIQNLIKLEGTSVTIRITIDRENANHMREFIDLLAKSPLANKVGLAFSKTIDYSFTPHYIHNKILTFEEFTKLEIELIKYAHSKGILQFTTPRPCPSGGCLRKGDIVIGAYGEIYKCLDTIGEKNWISGNISDGNTNIPDWYNDWLSWNPLEDDLCKNCKLLPLCNGGCPHNAIFSSKKHGAEDQCPDWKLNYIQRIILYVEEKLNTHEYQEI